MKDAKEFLEQGTNLSAYSDNGPFHCGDCKHLQGGPENEDGVGICLHPIVALDPALKHPKKDQTSVDTEHGCCRWVSQDKETDEDEETPEPLRKVLK